MVRAKVMKLPRNKTQGPGLNIFCSEKSCQETNPKTTTFARRYRNVILSVAFQFGVSSRKSSQKILNTQNHLPEYVDLNSVLTILHNQNINREAYDRIILYCNILYLD